MAATKPALWRGPIGHVNHDCDGLASCSERSGCAAAPRRAEARCAGGDWGGGGPRKRAERSLVWVLKRSGPSLGSEEEIWGELEALAMDEAAKNVRRERATLRQRRPELGPGRSHPLLLSVP